MEETVALGNLLATLIPLGMKVYTGIQQANADQLKPLADVIASADADWNAIVAKATAELAKAKV